MCDFTLNNNLTELHIYFEHPIDKPNMAEWSTDSSSSSDSYESAEDEVYKSPPPGYESDDSEAESPKKARKGKFVSPVKKIHIPKRRVYQGKKKKDHILNGSGSGSGPANGSGPGSSSGVGPSSGSGSGVGNGNASASATGLGLYDADFGPNMEHAGSFEEEIQDEAAADIPQEDIDYEYQSEGFNSPVSDDERAPRPASPNFNEEARYGEIELALGMQFASMKVFRNALKDVFIFEGRDLQYLKNEPGRLGAKCAIEGCPWMIFTSRNSVSEAVEIKTFRNEHTCRRNYTSNMADKEWVMDKLVKRLRTQPKLTPKEATEHMQQDYRVQLHAKKIARALKAARGIVLGNEAEQFSKMRDYVQEIHRSNPGSTACMEVHPMPQGPNLFDRVYISLDACKKGFKAGCRPLIGLDGCFLKGYYRGQLLTATTQDANNHVFSIAYVVTKVENTDNWKWFLTKLDEA